MMIDNNSPTPQPTQNQPCCRPKCCGWQIVLGLVLLLAVAAGSYWLGAQKSIPVAKSSQPTPFATKVLIATPTTGSTTEWQIFQSKEFFYQIKYPPEVKLGKRPPGAPNYYDDVTLSVVETIGKNDEMVNGLSINIRRENNSQKLSPREWLNDQDRVSTISHVIDFSIAGLNAIRVFGQGMYPFDEVIIPRNNGMLVIQGIYVGENKEKYRKYFDQILGTFKFLE